jgi:hypothetical protein
VTWSTGVVWLHAFTREFIPIKSDVTRIIERCNNTGFTGGQLVSEPSSKLFLRAGRVKIKECAGSEHLRVLAITTVVEEKHSSTRFRKKAT